MYQLLLQMDKFKSLPISSIEKLMDYSHLKKLKKGEHLFFDKDKCLYVFLVISGMVSIYKSNQQNDKKVIFVLGKGQLVNEEILHDLPVSSSCESLEEVDVICIPKQIMLEVMQQDFQLTKIILESVSVKVRRLYRQLKNTTGSVRMDKKVAAKLWKLSEDYGIPCNEGTCIDLDLSITFLAEMLGAKRETISRQLKILQTQDLIILKNNKFILPNKKRLADFFKS